MTDKTTLATLAAITVTADFPFYLYGAWIMIGTETVSWDVLVYHLKTILPGLVLNTIPVITWMLPRLFRQFSGLSALHVILDLQTYVMLISAFTGVVHIFQAKWEADLYHDPDQGVSLDDLHENMGAWHGRLRVSVFDYIILWVFVQLLGVYRYLSGYVFS